MEAHFHDPAGFRNIFVFKIIVPADPNQTDRAVRFAAAEKGNVYIAMGRSKLPVITDVNNVPMFGDNYNFQYGKADIVRDGDYTLFTYGSMLFRALKIRDILKEKGISLGVVNISSPAFIDDDKVYELLDKGLAFVYEDHISAGGLFGTLAGIIASKGIKCRVVPYGINKFPFSGTPEEVFQLIGLDPASVAENIAKEIKK